MVYRDALWVIGAKDYHNGDNDYDEYGWYEAMKRRCMCTTSLLGRGG